MMLDLHRMSAIVRRSWRRIATASGGAPQRAVAYADLVRRYGEPWRAYHTMQHLEESLAWFEASGHLAEHPAEVESALWFHDAIYDPRRDDNEDLSAQLAVTRLLSMDAPPDFARRVAELVLVTKHCRVPSNPDERLLVDIDLSILGAPPERFARYERQLRVEYSFVPEAVFRQKRQAILKGFLARPSLYATEFFRNRLEQQARVNLTLATGEGAA